MSFAGGALAFCPPCSRTRPYCHSCQAPIGASLFLRGRSVCCRCFADLSRCGACRREGCAELFPSKFMRGLEVCRECLDVRMGACADCGDVSAVGPEGICLRCQLERPEFPDLISERLWEVRRFLEEAFGMKLYRGYSFALVTEFPEIQEKPGFLVRGTFAIVDGCPRIHVRAGMPEPVVMSVFAHEYTHAWQAENCPGQSYDLSEGFARWIQRKVLYELYEDQAAAVLDVDDQPGYGPGLRACLAWEKRLGERGLLRAVAGWRKFPPLLCSGNHSVELSNRD